MGRATSALALLIALSAGADEGSYRVVARETITFELSPKFLPPSIPKRPLDEHLRVGLELPIFEPATSATAPIWIEVGETVKEVTCDFAHPTAALLPNIVSRLFPRTEIVRSGAEYDVIVKLDLRSWASQKENKRGVMELTGTLTVLAPDATTITAVVGHGRGEQTRTIYWSERSAAKAVGGRALQQMLDQIVHDLAVDPALKAWLQQRAAERARPSSLETTARFDDSHGFFPNGRLDAGETASLVLTVRNRGPGPAFGIQLRLSSGATVSIPTEAWVGDLAPDNEREVSVPIVAGIGIDGSVQQLSIETLEKRGYGGRPVILQLGVEKLQRPRLELADVRLLDGAERARGDGDGRPSNGETVEIVVLVRNSGAGNAVGATLNVSSPLADVDLLEPTVNLPAIAVGGVREGRMLVRLPVTFASPELPLTISAVEHRGAEVSQVTGSQTWSVQLKRPAVEFTYRMYDGNSAGSTGDRDGAVNNGEVVELAITPVNRGTLAARDVQFLITSKTAGVTVERGSFAAGEIPPQAEGVEQRVRLAIPRTLGRDAPIREIALVAAWAQRDFPASEKAISLSFETRRPQLVVNVISPAGLVAGAPATFLLETSNEGGLAAQGVQIEAISENEAVELLDERGVPAKKLKIDLGSIEARSSGRKTQIRAHLRRSPRADPAALKIVVSERDFAPIERRATFRIAREEAAVITPAPPAARPERPAPSVAATPATISFRRYEDGDRVIDETIVLRFEVQSRLRPDEVRLQQKPSGRTIELSSTDGASEREDHLWQYQQRIPLDYGMNGLEVVVVTPDGIRSSRTLSLFRNRTEGKVWVAVVGISRYADERIPDLQFASVDAAAVRDYYRDRLALPDAQLIQLLDENATLANIKRTLGTDLVARANNPDDTVILYFAGHGEKEPDVGSLDTDGYSKYLLPHDADPSDLFGSALGMEEVARILQRLRPERVVLIIDSCFSGAARGGRTPFDPNEATRSVVVTDEFLSRMATVGKGRVILTASSANEVARERADLGHGIFTYYFLQGLTGQADEDGDGHIDVDEIYKFVSRSVTTATRGQQNPMKRAPSVTGTVVVGKTAARTGLPSTSH